jgi:hypothetical protein
MPSLANSFAIVQPETRHNNDSALLQYLTFRISDRFGGKGNAISASITEAEPWG